MKLSEQTLLLLKNFAVINPSILFRPGSVIATRAIVGSILADATIEEEIPHEFCLYDLQEFLNTLKLFSSPVLDFDNASDNFLYICEEDDLDYRVQYAFTEKKLIVYPTKRVIIKTEDITFKLDRNILDSITKASNVMQLPYLVIVPNKDPNKVSLEVTDTRNKSSNVFSVAVDGTSPDKDFKIVFKMEALKLLPYDYDVIISGNNKSKFESDVVDYYIGCDSSSRL